MKSLPVIKLEYKHIDRLEESFSKLEVSHLQTYFPPLSLYFTFYNNDSYRLFTLRNKHYIYELKGKLENKYDDSYIKNIFTCDILDSNSKKTETDIFIKINPIMDVINYIKNDYRYGMSELPNIFNYTTNCKVNSYNNTAYIDALFTYIGNYYNDKHMCPTFPIFYGTFSGINNNFKFDITEEYNDMKDMSWFVKNLNTMFTLEKTENTLYKKKMEDINNIEFIDNSDNSENSDNSDIDKLSMSSDNWETDNSMDDSTDSNISLDIDDKYLYYCKINHFPVQLICLEKLDGTLDNYIEDLYEFSEVEWKSILFQISFGLSVAQKHHDFVHNDLHSSNIMFKKTEIEYMYFQVRNKYFRLPTFNKITKIIDFGRATFRLGEKVFFSDVFKKNGDAEGQYSYPYKNNIKDCKIKPNKSFDLSRLATTIAEHFTDGSDIHKVLKLWCSDMYGNNLLNLEDDFDLYKIIAKNVRSAIPIKQLDKLIFREFLIKKEDIPEGEIIYKY